MARGENGKERLEIQQGGGGRPDDIGACKPLGGPEDGQKHE